MSSILTSDLLKGARALLSSADPIAQARSVEWSADLLARLCSILGVTVTGWSVLPVGDRLHWAPVTTTLATDEQTVTIEWLIRQVAPYAEVGAVTAIQSPQVVPLSPVASEMGADDDAEQVMWELVASTEAILDAVLDNSGRPFSDAMLSAALTAAEQYQLAVESDRLIHMAAVRISRLLSGAVGEVPAVHIWFDAGQKVEAIDVYPITGIPPERVEDGVTMGLLQSFFDEHPNVGSVLRQRMAAVHGWVLVTSWLNHQYPAPPMHSV